MDQLELAALRKLQTIVLSDPLPERLDMIYLVGSTEDNEGSVLAAAISLMEHRSGTDIALGNYPEHGANYTGWREWPDCLRAFLNEPSILLIDRYDEAEITNTYTEEVVLARYLKIHPGYRKICIIAPPFHQLRSFISAVTAFRENGLGHISIFNQPGTPLAWDEAITHSKGAKRVEGGDRYIHAARHTLIDEEFDRLLKYKNLLPPSKVLEYYLQRQ